MSENDSAESTETLYQTPTAVVIESEAAHEELEPSREEEELGASPELTGPVTRSGRKRKNLAPVKSAGKKKNKMNTMRSPPPKTPTDSQASREKPTPSQPPNADQAQAGQQLDLNTLLSSIQQSMNGMEARLSGKIDGLESSVAKNKESIVILTNTVNKNTVNLSRLESQMREDDLNFTSRVSGIVREVMSADTSSLGGQLPPYPPAAIDRSTHRLSDAQMDRYAKCRRSLRLWPIRGPDTRANIVEFLTVKLGFDIVQVEQDFGPLGSCRVVEPRSKVQHEVVVEFPSLAIRDFVKSSGHKLEGQRAGIRMELPNFLKSDFHILQNLSYKMKMANEGIKRSIKFDDDNFSLMLDIQLPGQEWRRIRPEQAREARRSDPSLNSGPLEMTSDMISGTLRTAGGDGSTTSQPAPSASGSNATPLGRRPS